MLTSLIKGITSLHLSMRNISIKHLTVFGFTAVMLPLVLTLLYGSQKLQHLMQQSSTSINSVALIVASDRQLGISLNLLQRTASQYIVLEERELLERVYDQQQQITQLLNKHQQLTASTEVVTTTQALSDEISRMVTLTTTSPKPSLEELQLGFKTMNQLSTELSQLSETQIDQQVKQVQSSATNTQKMLLISVIIIPLSILIAVLFSLMILKPLQSIQQKIQRLEQGKFNDKIDFTGAAEVQDIAKALEKMRQRLHALEQQKSSFIRHISHELKTPLAAIREGTELLYDNSLGALNESQKEVNEIIRNNVSRLQILIEGLLDFNIVLDSTSLLTATTVNIQDVIEECLLARKLELNAKQLTIKQDISALAIVSNQQQLSVIFDNLLSNAIKYSPSDGTITITAYQDDHQLICTIADQGEGLTNQQIEKVFDVFYQGPPPKNTQIKSSGLGLTIVKELLKKLDGEITLKNQPQHQGLIAVVTLPIMDTVKNA